MRVSFPAAPVSMDLIMSHNFPEIKVNRDRTVVAKNVFAVIAFRSVCTAYNQPSVSRTYFAQASRVSACDFLHEVLSLLSPRNRRICYDERIKMDSGAINFDPEILSLSATIGTIPLNDKLQLTSPLIVEEVSICFGC